MSRRVAALLCLLAVLAVPFVLGACGEDEPEPGETVEVVEGEPLDLGELGYNIQLTRFLNPDDVEDSEYLVGLPEPDPGTSYLGTFLVIKNESEEPLPSANDYVVRDTLDNEYEPLESPSPFSLDIGAEVAAESQLPIPQTAAATGPNQAGLLIFNVSDDVNQNRPLKMEISSAFGGGEVLLDL